MHRDGSQKTAESSDRKTGGMCKLYFDQSDKAGQGPGSKCRTVVVLKSPHWRSKVLNDLEERSSLAKCSDDISHFPPDASNYSM